MRMYPHVLFQYIAANIKFLPYRKKFLENVFLQLADRRTDRHKPDPTNRSFITSWSFI